MQNFSWILKFLGRNYLSHIYHCIAVFFFFFVVVFFFIILCEFVWNIKNQILAILTFNIFITQHSSEIKRLFAKSLQITSKDKNQTKTKRFIVIKLWERERERERECFDECCSLFSMIYFFLKFFFFVFLFLFCRTCYTTIQKRTHKRDSSNNFSHFFF